MWGFGTVRPVRLRAEGRLARLPPTIIIAFYLAMSLPRGAHKDGPSVPRNQEKSLTSVYVYTFRGTPRC